MSSIFSIDWVCVINQSCSMCYQQCFISCLCSQPVSSSLTFTKHYKLSKTQLHHLDWSQKQIIIQIIICILLFLSLCKISSREIQMRLSVASSHVESIHWVNSFNILNTLSGTQSLVLSPVGSRLKARYSHANIDVI